MKMTPRMLRRGLNMWPPYLGAGVRVVDIAEDWMSSTVTMRHNRFTRNGVGTAFGGTLSSMTDPFYMLMLGNLLGDDYVVWDKAAEIDFVRPGRSHLTAHMTLSEEAVAKIRTETADGDKSLTWFETVIVDEQGETVAKVRRQVYVRRKRERGAVAPAADAVVDTSAGAR